MQQEPAPARSPGPQQDPALPHTPTMPPPESVPEGHQPSPSPAEQTLEEEFQFLRCQACQLEAKCPKLLPCLHTLCSGCLQASSLQCPICQLPGPLGADSLVLDNIFFESLQRRLSVYRQIVDVQAVCNRCKESADFWCFECEKLLCAKCFEAHQWFVKHEVRPLAELRGQSVREFLDGMRKSNNIFCSNPIHCPPMLTSIYCRGCSKPLCCSCALLDNIHSELKCDISTEIQQRQEELDAMAQALQEQDHAFGAAQARMRSAVSQLDRARADIEEQIHTHVRQLVTHVLAQEQVLLEGVSAQYQRSYEEIAGQLGRLETVLQRIRLGGSLVQRMKRYASDQEVLDLHGFLREALGRLRQEEPQNLQTSVRTDSFNEFKVRLQELVSCITQGTDATLPRRASPEAANTPRDSPDIDLAVEEGECPRGIPEEVQRALAQDTELAETQTMPLVQPVPGVHPVPVHAYSIKDSCREEVCSTVPPQKRKSCQTECPRKAIKMESEEERETRLARSSPEQPRPSTSKAVSPPHLDGPSSPEGPTVGSEGFLPNNNHAASNASEAEERVVVISSSEDSDAENSCTEPMETAAPHSSPAHPLPRAQGAYRLYRASRLPPGACRLPAWSSHRPAEQAAVSEAEFPHQLASHQEDATICHRRGTSFLPRRAQRTTRLHRIFRLPLKVYCKPGWTYPPPEVQATTPATTGSPGHPATAQEGPCRLQRAMGQRNRRRARGAVRSLGSSLRGSPVAQWLNNFFALPLSSVAAQLDTSVSGENGGRQSTPDS
ncbi:protein PML isoform X7 [Meles meles]|uniref:protein PML isoform X7 n=1 Tax=Meles meles TaxID=9662 RepID=UPI001E69C52E|nr:protein PML isoform X7 [Meles meles]